jgi:hypothetical protein
MKILGHFGPKLLRFLDTSVVFFQVFIHTSDVGFTGYIFWRVH